MRIWRLLVNYFNVAKFATVYALFTGHSWGSDIRPNFDRFFWYFLAAGILVYPLVADLEGQVRDRWRLRQTIKPSVRWHNRDVVAHDRGGDWRTPHSRVSWANAHDQDTLMRMSNGFLRELLQFSWIVFAPVILVIQAVLNTKK